MGNKNSCDEGILTMAGQLYFSFIHYDSATYVWHPWQRGLTSLEFGQENMNKIKYFIQSQTEVFARKLYFAAFLLWGKGRENQERIIILASIFPWRRVQYSTNPFIHCEEHTKYWCGPPQPFILSISNIILLPLPFILHVLCTFLLVRHPLSLILCSSFISFNSHISTGLRKLTQFKKPLTLYVFNTYVSDNKYRNKEYHLSTKKKSLESAVKVKELTFIPFLFYCVPVFSWFCLWNI